MSIHELMAKHMNEEKNMVEISFGGQHESLPSLLEVIREEDLTYNENITSRNNEELEKLERVEDDARDLKHLVIIGDEAMMSLKVIHFQSIFLIDFILKKTDLCAEMWNNSPNYYAAGNSRERRYCSRRSRKGLRRTDVIG